MAEVQLASASERQNWSNQYWGEYIRESGFSPYMGRAQTSIFRILTGAQTGGASIINIPLLGRLTGRGVEGAEVLEGNEEDLENFNDQVRTRWIRNGVVVPKSTSYRTEIDLLGAARPALKDWAANNMRDALIASLNSIIIPGGVDELGMPGTDTAVAYTSATAAQRNTFLANNTDRMLFGSVVANHASGVWATALGNVDNTSDKLTGAVVSLAKRRARKADPLIRPFRTEDGRDYFVMFAESNAFRDFARDPEVRDANKDARARGIDNPIFQGGDLLWDGVIVREIPELNVLSGVGAAGIDVARNFLCGQSAVAIAWEQQPTPRSDPDRDYGFRPGVATEELRGQKKVSRGGKNYGVVEVFTAATGDA
jgi:N4-gp56 family major capsid protein